MLELYSGVSALSSGEIFICPTCKHTIKLDEQRPGGDLAKKGGHQVFTTLLTWEALCQLRGSKDMEELMRMLINDHHELDLLKKAGISMPMGDPVMPPVIKQPSKTGHIKVHVVGNKEEEEKQENV